MLSQDRTVLPRKSGSNTSIQMDRYAAGDWSQHLFEARLKLVSIWMDLGPGSIRNCFSVSMEVWSQLAWSFAEGFEMLSPHLLCIDR